MESQKLNPLDAFKKTAKKEYVIAGIKFVFKMLTTEEDIALDKLMKEKCGEEITIKENNLWQTAARIDSIEDVPLKEFKSIKERMAKNKNITPTEAMVEELKSWTSESAYLVVLFYDKFQKEEDRKLKTEMDFLKS